jgi:hypothetical protein
MKPTVAIVACVTMICVTLMELYALHLGYDGAMIVTSVAAVVGVGSGAIGFRIAKGK